jgi:hypothetical protein
MNMDCTAEVPGRGGAACPQDAGLKNPVRRKSALEASRQAAQIADGRTPCLRSRWFKSHAREWQQQSNRRNQESVILHAQFKAPR